MRPSSTSGDHIKGSVTFTISNDFNPATVMLSSQVGGSGAQSQLDLLTGMPSGLRQISSDPNIPIRALNSIAPGLSKSICSDEFGILPSG